MHVPSFGVVFYHGLACQESPYKRSLIQSDLMGAAWGLPGGFMANDLSCGHRVRDVLIVSGGDATTVHVPGASCAFAESKEARAGVRGESASLHVVLTHACAPSTDWDRTGYWLHIGCHVRCGSELSSGAPGCHLLCYVHFGLTACVVGQAHVCASFVVVGDVWNPE